MKTRPSTSAAVAAGSTASRPQSELAVPGVVAALVAAVVAILVYLPALRNGFVWDDPLVLAQLRALRTWGDLLVMPPEIPHFYYRPLIFVSYLADRALGGEAPFWFHVSVVAVHAVNCLLVYRLAAHVFRRDVPIAAASALLFAVLPTHVESVAWMAGRSDVIACTFLILTVCFTVRRDEGWTAWAGGLTLFLGLLSKELAVAGLVLVPVTDWLEVRRVYWRRYVPLLVAALAYFVLRWRGVGGVVGGSPVPAGPVSVALDLLRALGFYVVGTVAPVQLSPYLADVPGGLVYVLLGMGGLLLAAWWVYRGWPQTRWPLLFLLLWFALTLAPSLTVIVRRSASAPVADRYLYVPSVASCMLAAWAIVAVARRRRLGPGWAMGIVAAVALVLAIGAASYARVWTDNITFWSAVAAKQPTSGLAQRELGSALLDRERLDEAERALQAALALPLEPAIRAMTYSDIGLIRRRKARFDDAVAAFESALGAAPHPAIYHNLGMTLMAKAGQDQSRGDTAAVGTDVRQARAAFEKALSFETAAGDATFREQWDPAKTHALLGQVLLALGDRSGAREQLEIALRLQPTGSIAETTRRQLAGISP